MMVLLLQRKCGRHLVCMGRHHRVPVPCAGLQRAVSTTAEGDEGRQRRGDRHWGFVCVPEGQRYAFWNALTGQCEQVDGPERVWSFGSRVQPLKRHTAGPAQYLKVCSTAGGIDFTRGPTSMWQDPMQHRKVSVRDALEVGGHEAIVVYRDVNAASGAKNKVARSTIHGPMLYVPDGLEWLHRFAWHGTDPATLNLSVQRKVPGAISFEKLRLTPDQIFYDIPDVRTRDDALLTVKVVLFLQLVDIERMLDNTHDPISEFMNALAADVIHFGGSRSFEQFKADTNELNSLSAYPNLTMRSDLAGFKLSKILFRGYLASSCIQEMHDEAIHKRTELILQKETQEQEQDLKDFKLERDSLRAERLADFKLRRAQERQAMQMASVQHSLQVKAANSEADLERQVHQHEQELRLANEQHAQHLRHQAADHTCAEDHYRKLRDLDVDLSRYLSVVARGAPHRVIEVDAAVKGGDAVQPRVHIHSGDDA